MRTAGRLPRIRSHQRADIILDRQAALDAAAAQLEAEFGAMLGSGTIDRSLQSSYHHFAAHSPVPDFLPLLADRFTRRQLRALAQVGESNTTAKPTVLFLYPHSAARSQMAQGSFTHLAGDAAVARSGGSEPSDDIDPATVAAMVERGIDISHEYPKP